MKKNREKIKLIKSFRFLGSLAVLFFSIFISRFASAASAINDYGLDTVAGIAGLKKEADPLQIAKIALNAIFGILGLIFLVLIISAGFKWMTAGGNSETITKTKEQIINASIGLIIVFAAWAISQFVFSLMGIKTKVI